MDQTLSGSTHLFLGKWKGGDNAALGELVVRFTPLLLQRVRSRPAYQVLAPRMSAEDVVQEVWAAVLRRGPESIDHRERGAFVAWLARVSDHKLVDLVRHHGASKRGGVAGDLPLESMAEKQARPLPGEAAPSSPTGKARQAEFLALARKVLTERELLAWSWVALKSYSSEEAALAMDCSAAAVRSLLLRSRDKLRGALRPRDPP